MRSPSVAAPVVRKPEFRGGAVIGALRHIVIAETDEEARALAKPNVEYHVEHLNWLRKKHAQNEAQVRGLVPRGVTFEEWEKDGMAIAGSPATVGARSSARRTSSASIICSRISFFGTLTLETGHALARADGDRGDAEDRETVGLSLPTVDPPLPPAHQRVCERTTVEDQLLHAHRHH